MWPAYAFYLTTACSWLAACFAIRRPPWPTGAIAQAAFRRTVVAYCGWCTLFLPPVYRALDKALGIPNGTRLLLALTAIIGAFATQPWLNWFVPPEARLERKQSTTRSRAGLAVLESKVVLGVTLAGSVASFFLIRRPSGIVSEPLNGAFLIAYRRDWWLLLFLLLTHGFVAGVFLRLIAAYLPVVRGSLHRFPDPIARCRFQCFIYTAMLGLFYNVHELARVVLYYAGLPASPASHSATASLVLAVYNVAELWCYYGSFRWLAHYLAYHQFESIWWALYRAIPTITHRPPRSRFTDGIWLGPRAVGDRLRSRIFEIWDGISTLYPYRSAALARRARAACVAAGLPDEEIVPVVEATLLRGSIAAKERDSPPAQPRAPLPTFAQDSLGEQIVFLQRVAWAWTHAPIVASLGTDERVAEDGSAQGRLPEHQEIHLD